MTAGPQLRKKVLFVDDESMLLDLYKLAFQVEGEVWDIDFAPSGREALARMAGAPVDVLVSDMRMPGMSGAELLLEVVKRYPRTSRLIMSGYADSQQIAQCLDATHQFIAKPFEIKLLRGTITRVCALDSWLLDERLKSLVAQLRNLPSLPTIYFRIMEAVASPASTFEQIGAIIASDPSMTAKILQLVNSAFFGIARRISNPTEAVQFLGVGRVRSLVLSLHIFSCFEEAHVENFSLETVWKHSLATALVAQKIGRLQKLDRTLLDETYVAGMLHDIGKVMLAASLPGLYGQALQLADREQISLVAAEREIFGATHAQVGAYLLSLWGLPITIVEAVAFQHNPAEAAGKVFAPLTAVHFANVLESRMGNRAAHPQELTIDSDYLAALGLTAGQDEWVEAADEVFAGMV